MTIRMPAASHLRARARWHPVLRLGGLVKLPVARLGIVVLVAVPVAVAACGSDQPAATHPDAAGSAPTSPAGLSSTQYAARSPQASGNWKLTWESDFSKPGALKKDWLFYSGGTGFGNRQLQWYDAANATVDKAGQLVITARTGSGGHTCWYGRCKYTSARMETINKFSQKYGKFEARIKLPPGRGLWPAFWIEGANITKVGWPACGEIDVVEPSGKNPVLVPGFAHSTNHVHRAYLTVSKPISAGFHTYAVAWTPKGITWYFDGYAYSHLAAYKGWAFNHKFFVILNLAVGGGYSGSPTGSTKFPAKMIVDWVRVYRQA